MLTKKEIKGKMKENKIMRKGIIFGIGILIILLALAGTGSASLDQHRGLDCYSCHSSGQFTSNQTTFYNQTHRYNDTVQIVPICTVCHAGTWTYGSFDFSLKTGTPTYMGSAICEDCHKAKYDIWSNTTHAVMLTPAAKANETMHLPLPPQLSDWSTISYVLVTKFQFSYINTTGYWLAQNDTYNTETKTFGQVEYNASSNYTGTNGYGTCARCHTTGYNATGDNSSLPGIIGNFSETGIACERCHGPAGNGHQVTVNYSSNLCTVCHAPTGHHATGWENGGHTKAQEHMDSNADCTICHSPFDKYKTGNVSVQNATAVSCGVCHNSHDITDSQYANTFNGFTVGNFAADTWSVVADSKLSFFNSTASTAAGTDVFDDLESILLIKQGRNFTDRPVSEKLCASCHFNHGLAHMSNVNLTHANGAATCIDCHMDGANAKVGRGMMNNHDNVIDSGKSCGGAKVGCHGTSNKTIIDPLVGNGSESMQKRFDEWGATLHNDENVGHFAQNITTGNYSLKPNNCLVCHDPMNYNPAEKYNYTSVQLTKETFKGITCMVCHNLHDMGDWFNATFNLFGTEKAYGLYEKVLVGTRYKGTYKMVENTTELCGSCHSNDHPRLKAVGSYAEPGWPSNASNPNSPHGFPAAELFVGSWKQKGMLKFECTSCHYSTMSKDVNGTNLSQDQRIRGHSFQVNTTILMNNSRDCYTCHITGSALGNLSTSIENVQDELHDQWNVTNVTVMSALVNVKAYTGENTSSRAKIAQAYWNIKLVDSDKSWGVHNPDGTRKLLNDAVTLANEAVDSLGEATSSVDLVVGWNLVALNGTPSVTASKDVLSSVSSNITVVWGYNASASNPIDKWELYDPAMAAELNDLKTIVPGKGYWINAIKACKWTV
jgi:formate-dependent nitrite reductase cytochrome c552 subunit